MVSVTQLGYLGIGAGDLGAWERFATEVLGLQLGSCGDDGSLFLRMDDYHHRITIHPGGNDDVAYIGWELKDEQSLCAIGEQLQAAGVAVATGTQAEADARHVLGLLKLQDPSGIPTELFYGPLMSYERPFRSPRSISGFVAGDQGLGHMVLIVDDPDESLRFYRDLLGMRVTDFVEIELAPGVKPKLAFLHCNPRHHSVAFLAAPLPKRLQHFMLQAQSVDDVGATYSLCEEQGIPIAAGLGRHSNDHMFSFYLRSPSGFEVEFGWGAREVDDATWQVQKHESGSLWGHRGLGEMVTAPAAEAAPV
jgi:2,3-dihydroxybiphenyl 1,2-dioxygenase